MDAYFGEYGGRVARKFIGSGEVHEPGDVLFPEDVEKWPLSNRKALQTTGKVKWFGPPANVPEEKPEPQPKSMRKRRSKTKKTIKPKRKKDSEGDK